MRLFMEIVLGAATILLLPVLTFFIVKFGRYGYLKANKLFARQENKNK